MDSNIYSFSGIDIHPSTREVRAIRGTAELEPRAFDLLLCLVENRHRVVTKEELLDKVWKTPHVSESVLARAVMKLRKGIADVGGNPDVVKTIHRVGYRFLGDDKESSAPATPAASPRRFVLLPFANDTGDPLMDWVELGLNTLVARNIAAGAGVSAVPIEDVLRALALGAEDVPLAARVARVKRALGVESIFSVSVSSQSRGSYLLSWQAWSNDQAGESGALEGSNLTSLAVPLAASFQKLLAPHREANPPRVLSSDEEFMNAAHARALHAFASHQYVQALSLIEICVAITPHPLQVDVDHVEVLAMLDAARAREIGLSLLDEIDEEVHPQEKLTLLCALAQSAMTARDWNRCEALCDEIDAILSKLPDEFSAHWSWYLRFEIAHERGEINSARQLARQAVQHYLDRNDRLNQLGWMTELAKLELSKGDWQRGRSLINDALKAARSEAKPPSFLATPLNNLALTSIWRGLVPDARVLLEEALPMAQSQKAALVLAATYVNLYVCHSEAGNTQKALGALNDAEPFIERSDTRLLAYGGMEIDRQIRFGSLDAAHRAARQGLTALESVEGVHRTFGQYLIGLIASGALKDAEDQLQSAVAYRQTSGSVATWNYLHAKAHLHYAKNDLPAAVVALGEYLKDRGSLAAGFQGSTDLLWLRLELGDLEAAMQIAGEVSDHLNNTVRGLLCKARLALAQGEFAAALASQAILVERAEGRRARPYFEELLHYYERVAHNGKAAGFPRPELLPSML